MIHMKIINELNSFIDLAEKNRKYATNTALGYKASLKRLAEILNEDESISLPLIEQRFPQIMTAFYNKHKDEMSASSMDVYKKRIKKVIKDYTKWGPNLQDWSGWIVLPPTPRNRGEKKDLIQVKENDGVNATNSEPEINSTKETSTLDSSRYSGSTRFEIPLRTGVHAFVSTPSDITKEEAKKIGKYIDYLIEISREE